MNNFYNKTKTGQAIVAAILFVALALILSASLFSRVAIFVGFGANNAQEEQATYIAEAGIERALWQLNETAGSYTGEVNTQLGQTGTFTVAIENKSTNLKTITSTGFVPSAQNPRAKRTIKVDTVIDSSVVSFRFALQVGNGGLTMANSSSITGTVFSNGNITGSGSSLITGDAYAVGSISSPHPTVLGSKYTSQEPTTMPTIDDQIWKDAASEGGTTVCSPTCTISTNTAIGPQKYEGDLTITNNAVVTINGAIWVTGNLTVTQGGTEVNLNDSFGSRGTVIIADGLISINQGSSFNPTTSNPKGYILVVTTSFSPNAVTIENSGANAVFYALNGGAQLSQTAQVNSLAAGTLSLSNNVSLVYDSGLAGAQFSVGPGASWQIRRGTYRFTQ